MTVLSAFPITPSNADGQVDLGALRTILQPLVEAGVGSIGLLGSTGTYPFLARHQRRRAVEAAVEAVAGRVPLLVGVGALRTDEAVRMAQDAKGAGAQAGLLAAMSYTPLTEDEVFEHCATVARDSGLPLCLYDNPGTTHFRFTPELVGRLARVPGIVAVKSPSPEPEAAAEHVRVLRAAVPAEFTLGYSGDWNAVEALLAGGEAWYSVFAGLFPRSALAITRAVEVGDAAEARRLNARLAPLWELFRTFSSLRVAYACANPLGLCRAEPPRPILPVTEEVRRRIADTLATLELS
ncbi:dihydrodipicolinate synthase family protein [Methylobacterium sp. Leaf117]|uniref:dihydrodipicolinate synthase family protein n=1 Tax=Methylobacterium sp. Leaf117 TaxID=1736260 RepID=UPI0006F3E0FD|nr:dihydrodipicolinate synthase family protein [Methylobacterium sp. Leaf117]KQP80447.1 dihydrodipicolinate synthase [Methylobacterium sp. Leaf117]